MRNTSSGSELPAQLGEDEEQEGRRHRREVKHPHPGHDAANRGEDGLGDLEDHRVDRVGWVETRPGEDDADEDRRQQDVGEDLDENADRLDD